MTRDRSVRLLSLLLLSGVALAAHAEAQTMPQPVVDDLGNEITLETRPHRIVSLAPSNTELAFALGLGDRLVGVTEFCNYPEAARRIEQVAGYSTLSAEMVAAVRPDLVLAARGNDPEGLETLRGLGIPVFALANNSVDDVIASVGRLGLLTGYTGRADTIVTALTGRVRRVRERVEDRPKPLVMWGFALDPIYTAGEGSLIDDVIRRAGGRNAGRRAGAGWPQISLETVVGWAPDVWLTSLRGGGGAEVVTAEAERLRGLDGWRSLPAIRDGRIVHVEGDLLTRAGPRIVDALEQLADALHPPSTEAVEER